MQFLNYDGVKYLWSKIKTLTDSIDAKFDNYIPSTEKGAKSGVAPLNASGVIDAAYLPSYVDDVLEYNGKSNFPTTGETGKIYVDTSTNLTYRYTGSAYVEISASTVYTAGVGLTASGNTFKAKLASETSIGTASAANKIYNIGVDASGNLAVAVPWTSYTLPTATSSALGGIKIGYSESGKNYAVKLDSNGKAYVNVPWENTEGTIDSALDADSTNAVQNKVVKAALDGKVDAVSGKGLSTNDYTTTEKSKLAAIASGAEVNQNAFTKVVVGSTTIAADAKEDSITIVAGSNITLTPDATNDKITIAATNTTYSVATSSANGLMSSTDKAKLDAITSAATADSALSDSDIDAAIAEAEAA